MVLGHVDGMGRVRSLDRVDAAYRFAVEAPRSLARFWAPKGSVAVQGVSLTINELLSPSGFVIMLVPHTLKSTTLRNLGPGDPVNLEVDVLARYVARQLDHAGITSPASADDRLVFALSRGGFLQGDGGLSR